MQKFFSYIYGNNNPLNYIDPQGTIAFLIPVVMGALTLYSAYQTGKALAEGDYKRAAFEAIGLIPVGKVGTLAVKGALKIAPKLVSKGKTLLAAGKNVAKGVVTFAKESGVGKHIGTNVSKFMSETTVGRTLNKAASTVSDFGQKLFFRDMEGIGTFSEQGGHHPLAKIAFMGISGYDYKKVLTISEAKLATFKVLHRTITGKQSKLYREFIKTGEPFTMKDIEIRAMVEAKIPIKYARHWVRLAEKELKRLGIKQPIHLPWSRRRK